MTTSSKASLQHPLGRDASIPKKIDEERLAYLTARIRAGSITQGEREELARGFIRLGLAIASGWATKRPSSADDYAGAALFGIAYALEKAREKLVDDNLTGWVISNIKRFVRRFHEINHMVRVPSSTYHKARSEGRDLGHVEVVNIGDDLEMKQRILFQRIKVRPSGSIFELKELLLLSARDERDRSILRLRSEGYTDKEIAERLEISASYVQRKRSEMEERFNKLVES